MTTKDQSQKVMLDQKLNRKESRRSFLQSVARCASTTGLLGLSAMGCSPNESSARVRSLKWQEYFKKHYRLMTPEEKVKTIRRLEELSKRQLGVTVSMSDQDAVQNTLFGYAFNISRCKGFMDCVKACVHENNVDRISKTQYIRIFEMEHGQMDLEHGQSKFYHQVPREDRFYMGIQCFQCENPPCIKACPVKATWKEPDGIVVVDYDWCIGCRYCHAACPYWGRRFNWKKPEIPREEITTKQHYLGNRIRPKGVIEKCTYCIQRSRHGRQPACVEACPTGSRVFGNLLDPTSEIRYILRKKKVFRYKEDLNTDPKFWYFMD